MFSCAARSGDRLVIHTKEINVNPFRHTALIEGKYSGACCVFFFASKQKLWPWEKKETKV